MKNLDLINWTIQEAEHLKTERHEPGAVDDTTPLDKLFAVLEREPVGRASQKDPVAQIAGALRSQNEADDLTGQPSFDVVDVPPKADVISNFPSSTEAAPSTSANGWVEAQLPELLKALSNLHKAIVESDISAAEGDRDRAIALRWVLRDIQSKRLKWSPVNQQDLRILIIMGLVEIRDEAPVLTNAGVSAIV